jgi:hypothetical protein
LGRAAFHLSRNACRTCAVSQAAAVMVEGYGIVDKAHSLARMSAGLLPGILVGEGVQMVKKVQPWCISSCTVIKVSCANW